MSIFSDFVKGVSKVAGAVGSVLPGPLGTVAKGISTVTGALVGGGGTSRPTTAALPVPVPVPTGGGMSSAMPVLPQIDISGLMGGARAGAVNNAGLVSGGGLVQSILDPFGGIIQAGKTLLTGGYQTGSAAAQNIVGPSGGGIPTKYGVLQGRVNPVASTRQIHKCPRGYALALDGYCYPRAMLPRWARKWKPESRPVVSRADQKAIRRADSARKRLVKLTKASGAHASLHAPHHDHKPFRRRR